MRFRVPHDVKGCAVEPELGSGRGGSRCTSRRHDSPDASWQQRRVYIRRSDAGKYGYSMNSWMQISDDGHDCSRAGGWRNALLKMEK